MIRSSVLVTAASALLASIATVAAQSSGLSTSLGAAAPTSAAPETPAITWPRQTQTIDGTLRTPLAKPSAGTFQGHYDQRGWTPTPVQPGVQYGTTADGRMWWRNPETGLVEFYGSVGNDPRTRAGVR